MIDVALIGDEAALATRLGATHVPDVAAATFDDVTDTWQLQTTSGDQHRARVVVDTRTLHAPVMPDYPGRNDFDGPSFHWSEWPAGFEPHGRRIAVVGDRVAHIVRELDGSKVTLFDCPLNWKSRNAKRRLRRRGHAPRRMTSPVERITDRGIRTSDGTEHEADAIIYATGSVLTSTPGVLAGTGGQTLEQKWQPTAATYLGLAIHGFPNYFLVSGPDSPVGDKVAVVDNQVGYINECLLRMERKGSTRIEVRRSALRQFTQRARVKHPARAFDLAAHPPQELYDGPATLTIDGHDHPVRVRLTGHLDPIDGKYHWQGTVFDAATEFASQPVQVAIDARTSQARITEKTPWGSYSVAGVGAPPFERS